jgi:hypothetical protein
LLPHLDTASPPPPAAHRKDLRPQWQRKRWLTIGVPLAGLAFLVAIAPPLPETPPAAELSLPATSGEAFRYLPNDEVYALDFDPRQVRLDLLEGWDREQDAFEDSAALAYVSGPMYERHVNDNGQEITVPLGDIKLGERVWRGRNRTAARQRAFIGIRRNGQVDFGYGELTPERAVLYDSFIGGLHSVYNDLETPPSSYRGAYSISMGQQIRYYLPRIRMVMGLRPDGRLEVLMSRDGLTLEQTKSLARRRGLRAAYLPDHASKSRLIIPSVKGFTQDDANWISGGATSFVHVPYLLRLSQRAVPLQGNLIDTIASRTRNRSCGTPLECGQSLGTQILDRALAGFNRLMEQGVEPLARLIWEPKGQRSPKREGLKSPLREPPITADPMALRLLQDSEAAATSEDTAPLAPDLPSPLLLQDGMELPADPEATMADPGLGPDQPQADALNPAVNQQPGTLPQGAPPPPPLLPPVQPPPPLP